MTIESDIDASASPREGHVPAGTQAIAIDTVGFDAQLLVGAFARSSARSPKPEA